MPKATRLEQATRIETVRQLILSGNEHGRIVQQVAEKWGIKDRQAWNYLAKAQAAILAVTTPSREYLLGEHLAVRKDIRRRAREAKDLRAELAAAQDEAKLFGLYPSDKLEVTLSWRERAKREYGCTDEELDTLVDEWRTAMAARRISSRSDSDQSAN